jgi:hypothetical protein
LEELVFAKYGKPDVHIRRILVGINLIDNTARDYRIHQKLVEHAVAANVSPCELDKLLWLIGSGDFYLNDTEIGGHREEFINSYNELLATHH